ncbi:hypothetical protein J3R80_07230 [Aliiroseovarius sp. Z3]|uniref:AbiU2 domain-containing protein n=1 Tax=Aliiroseovarius sp. Z3 TaxID=2811402 RepID=UPI0023B328AC|nr:hypothetical protein [Aliiroseovarius sp. Z3]MDE9450260.1 hypothetical protein [Aliiroseovarius sp. Z3]
MDALVISRTEQLERIKTWQIAFTDHETGIHRTVQDLLWNFAAFQTSAEIVRRAVAEEGREPALNQMFFDLIAEGYWSNLLLGTRRLLDKSSLAGPKGVYSIRSVVKDVKCCQTWLNRKVYVESVHNAQYDIRPLEQQHLSEMRAKGGPVWGSNEITKSQAAHNYFDALSGVSQNARTPEDRIDSDIFDRIESRLSKLDRISEYTSSHIAHAGNRESRIGKTLEDFNLVEARETLKQIKEVTGFVGLWFANEGGAGLATYIGNQFEGLDQPMIPTDEISSLEERWQALDREIADWSIGATNL